MPSAHTSTKRNRARRINLRATHGQERLIRTGADFTGVTMTEFILKSACLQAEHVLADRRDFAVSPKQWQAFLELLDRPERVKPELARLFSHSKAHGRGPAK